jgi:HEAT repeat protein
MLMNKMLKSTILASVLIAATVLAQTPYDEGQKALREQNWTEAADQFKKAIKADKEQADASMYWRSHALYKAGHKSEAERQIRSLERKYPDSRWVKEARVLQIEHDGSEPVLSGATDGTGLDEELRLFALAQLMDRDPERALPLVLDMMNSTDSESVRSDTLFMLGMSDDPRAQQLIAQIARDSKNPDLQVNAIQMLGISSNQTSIDLLSDLYNESTNFEVKQAVIHAYIIADDSESLVDHMIDMLKTEKNPELQAEIIHALGVLDATEVMATLYTSIEGTELRKVVLESMMIADDADGLIKVLQSEKDVELRASAMEMLAVSGDKAGAEYLVKLYPDGSHEDKLAVIESMMIMDNPQGLISLMKKETDPELKREMLQMLTIMDSEESDEYLFQLLEKKG